MKKILYILVAIILLGGIGYYFYTQGDNEEVEEEVQQLESIEPQRDIPADEFVWSQYLPEEVPEYTKGEVEEFTIIDPEMARYEDEIEIIIEGTTYEDLNEYVEGLESDGWLVRFRSSQDESFYTLQLSFEEFRLSLMAQDDGILTFNYFLME